MIWSLELHVCRPMKVRIFDCRVVVDLAARNAVLAAVLKIVAAIKLPPKYRPAGAGVGGTRESLRSMPSGVAASADQASGEHGCSPHRQAWHHS